MTGEIKFRGMGIGGEWHYGLLSHPQAKGVTASGYIGWCISNSVGCAYAYSVRPETIGQFTGLKDSHGKDIYKGDIVKISPLFGDGFVSEVKWRLGPYVVRPVGFHAIKEIPFFHVDSEATEVIGNIYENPELLKEAA